MSESKSSISSPPNTTLAPCDYKTGRTLGQGSYAMVKEAVHIKTGAKYAVKVISKKLMAGREHLVLNEIKILQKISKGHPNIITLVDFFETPSNLYLVQDLCVGGELFDALCERGSFTEKDAIQIVRIILEATSYLHQNGIVHRDLKCENLLFRDKQHKELLVADFGLSKLLDKDTLDGIMTTCGTPGYMAPEVILKKGYGKPVDLWAIGVLTYFLLSGYTPFDMNIATEEEETKNVLAVRYSFPDKMWKFISENAKNFIQSLLVLEPEKRLTADLALQHKWITKPSGAEGKSPPSVNFLPNVKDGYAKRKSARPSESIGGGGGEVEEGLVPSKLPPILSAALEEEASEVLDQESLVQSK